MLQCVAVRCSVLQCAAACCSVLQHVAEPHSIPCQMGYLKRLSRALLFFVFCHVDGRMAAPVRDMTHSCVK